MSGAITVTEAKAQLSSLIERATEGEKIVIGRGQQPVAKLVRCDPPPIRRQMGGLRGKIERAFGMRD